METSDSDRTHLCMIPVPVDFMEFFRNLQLRRDPNAVSGYVDGGDPSCSNKPEPELRRMIQPNFYVGR